MARLINKQAAEGAAFRLHQKLRVKSPGQLDFEDVAMLLGILVKEGGVRGSSARLIRNGSRGIIRLNANIRELGARNFAISHEIGHWELHQNETQTFLCTSENFRDYKINPMEVEANVFASELLMPKFLFLPRIAKKDPSLSLIGEISQDFNASLTATAIRFMQLSKQDCVVALIHKGKIVWSWQKLESRSRGYLQKGQLIQPGSLAWELEHNRAEQLAPSGVDASSWFDHLNYPFEGELQEHSILMPNYSSILTLLWMP